MPDQPRRVNLDAMLETPWAIMPSTLSRLVEWSKHEHAVASPGWAPSPERAPVGRTGSIAVVPVHGVIEHRSDWMQEMLGGTSVQTVRAALAEHLADPGVRAIILDVDSPGGTVAGITELAAEIRGARGGEKPIVAVVNTLAASAAYWLAAQADQLVASPSAQVGNIGIYAVHQEASRMLDEMGVTTTIVSAGPHKTEGNEFEPLSEEARADLQARVDANYQQFLSDVAAGRGVTAAKVEADYGGGRVLNARAALTAGMVDRVETLAQTVVRLGTAAGRRNAMSAEGPELDESMPFTERVAALAAEADDLVNRAHERARLRAKEGRPAFSTATEESLRTIRGALDALLAPVDPVASAPAPAEPVDPTPAGPSAPTSAPVPKRFQTRDDWLRHLEATAHR